MADILTRMQDLIGYGTVKESKENLNKPVLEYHVTAANGETYGIIRESSKYYVKVAPKKDTEVLAEDYDYIGGFLNKDENEYNSYSQASKSLELRLMGINEQFDKGQRVEVFQPREASDWQVNETKEMRAEIDRMNEITRNVGVIMNESEGGFTMNHTLPEAPAKNPSEKKVNTPFTDTAVAKGDKDFNEKQTDPKKAGWPFDENGEVTNKDMQSDKYPKGNDGGSYCDKAQYVPDGAVANIHKDGGKAVKMNEARTLKLTESQILAWQKSKDFMDKSHGTEVGSSAPFTDKVDATDSNQGEAKTDPIQESEGTAVHNTDNQNKPAPGTNEIGDSAPFEKKVEGQVNEADEVPFPEVEPGGAYMDFEKDFNDWENRQQPDGGDMPTSDDLLNDDDYLDPALLDLGGSNPFADDMAGEFDNGEEEAYYEGRNRKGNRVNEGLVLTDFGKHPAYQKVPMTTPPNADGNKFGRDWNDDSAKGDKPFGQQIGKSDPYTEKVIDMLTDSAMKALVGGSLKKKSLSERKVLRLPSQKGDDTPVDNTPDVGGEPSQPIGGDTPPMPAQDTQPMQPAQAGPQDMGGQSEFDTNFDAGVDADEESDPKKYIQQLTGKLSQSLRKYMQGLPQPDVDLSKYVAGMVLSQTTQGLSYGDKQDILDKLDKGSETQPQGMEPDGQQPMNGGGQQMPPSDGPQDMGGQPPQQQPQMGNPNEGKEPTKEQMLTEIFQDLTDTSDEAEPKHNEIHNIGYRKTPFTSPNFK